MPRLADCVPARRLHRGDFKCSAPGEDEADLLGELARLARVDWAADGFTQGDGRTLTVRARLDGRLVEVHLQRRKYQFPPHELLHALNAVLAARADPYTLVACADGHDEAVARVRPDEREALRAAGLLV